MVAEVRADIHNCSSRQFDHHFQADDFMPGAADVSVEAKARKLMEQGIPPAAAVAMASSTRSREQNLHVLDSTLRQADTKKKSGKGTRARKTG